MPPCMSKLMAPRAYRPSAGWSRAYRAGIPHATLVGGIGAISVVGMLALGRERGLDALFVFRHGRYAPPGSLAAARKTEVGPRRGPLARVFTLQRWTQINIRSLVL